MLIPKNTLSFGAYKTRMKQLEEEQLELVKALAETTENLSQCHAILASLHCQLKKYVPENEIDDLIRSDLKLLKDKTHASQKILD